MIEYFKNLETHIKLYLFFGGLIVSLFTFTLKSYITITKSLEIIAKNQIDLKELNSYKYLTISSFVDKQYEKVLSGDLEDIKQSDIQLLSLYSTNLTLNVDIKYKIEKILSMKEVSIK